MRTRSVIVVPEADAPQPDAHARVATGARPAEVFTVCSASAGSGKTFYATNLAVALARATGGRVALVDLDLRFGEVLTVLRLRARHTVSDALAITDPGDLARRLPGLLATHESGVRVLPAPLDPGHAGTVDPADVLRVLDALRAQHDHVVVDTQAGLVPATATALRCSTRAVVLHSLDTTTGHDLGTFLEGLARLGLPADDVTMVLNKVRAGVGLAPRDVERVLPGGFRAMIPHSREVAGSMGSGMPLAGTGGSSAVVDELLAGLVDVLPDDAREAVHDLLDERSWPPWYRWLWPARGSAGHRGPLAAIPD